MSKPITRSEVLDRADAGTARELCTDAVRVTQLSLQVAQKVGPGAVRQELRQIAELGSYAELLLERDQTRPPSFP
jgi:hypothetical protein